MSAEAQLVDWLSRRFSARSPSVRVGIGDDMAGIDSGGGDVWIAADMLLDGVHFNLHRHEPRLIGRKAVACSLSDCAAMAVQPIAATVSLAWPRGTPIETIQQMYEGMAEIADEFDCAIVGGDTTAWNHPMVIDVAMLAKPFHHITPVRRDGATPGDRLWVTGQLGGSLLGRHLSFQPRIRQARRLGELFGPRLHAMMDISDGLSLDLHRICTASAAGAILVESDLQHVIHDDAHTAARGDGRPPIDHTLSDGEDFELLLALDPTADHRVAGDIPLLPIGRVVNAGLHIEHIDGTTEPLAPRGFQHDA